MMIRVQCSTSGCLTPHFVIPPPNTRTSLVYAEKLDLDKSAKPNPPKGVAQKGAPAPAKIATSGLLESNSGNSTAAQLNKIDDEIAEILDSGLTITTDVNFDNYLVVYCDSGHKNIVFY